MEQLQQTLNKRIEMGWKPRANDIDHMNNDIMSMMTAQEKVERFNENAAPPQV